MLKYLSTKNLIQYRSISYKKLRTWYAGLVKPKPVDPPYGHIVQIGDPTLRTQSETIPLDSIKSPEIKYLINVMKYVFEKYNCVGLSAPQVGIPLTVLMFEFNSKHMKSFAKDEVKKKEMHLQPFTIVINPQIKITDYSKIIFGESCESIKGFHADVPRFRGIKLEGYDRDGGKFETDLIGWNARIIQHEMDHLNGCLYTDVMDKKTLTCSCWQIVNERRGKVEMPYGVF